MEKEIAVKNAFEFSLEEVEKLRRLNARLTEIVPGESTKIQLELVYFDLLHFLRGHGLTDEPGSFIAKLRQLHEMMIHGVNDKRRTTRNGLSAIKTFKNSMRIILRDLIRSNPSDLNKD